MRCSVEYLTDIGRLRKPTGSSLRCAELIQGKKVPAEIVVGKISDDITLSRWQGEGVLLNIAGKPRFIGVLDDV